MTNKTGGSRFTRPVRKPVKIARKPILRAPTTKSKLTGPRQPVPVPPAKNPVPPTGYPALGAEGRCELNPATARALEGELREIMIKVWQTLPDEAPTDEEKMVIKKFKNDVSDDLRNALGLYVTERLLNTFNPLNVKVHFSSKPERKYLRHFLKRYNFVAFKRIVRVMNTFAAQVKTIADYDDLCSNKNIFCGTTKITVSPCYRFTQCPKNLKTIYGIPEEDNFTENINLSGQGSKELNVRDTAKETKTEKGESQTNSTLNTAVGKEKELTESKVHESMLIGKVEGKVKQEGNIKTGVISHHIEVAKTAPKADVKSNIQKTIRGKPAQTTNIAPKTSDVKHNLKQTTTKPTEVTNIAPTATDVQSNVQNATIGKKTEASNPALKSADTKPNIQKSKVTPDNKAPSSDKPLENNLENAPVIIKSENAQTQKITTIKNAETATANSKADIKTTIKTKPDNNPATKHADDKDVKKTAPTANSAINTKTVDVCTLKPTDSKDSQTTTTKAANTKIPSNLKSVDVKNEKTSVANKKVSNLSSTKSTDAKSKNETPDKTNKITPIKIPETQLVANMKSAKDAKNVSSSKQVNKKMDVKKQTDTKKPARGDDFEELDDNELYQYLMSAGIVLDECSGSDDE